MSDAQTYYATYCRLDTESADTTVIIDGNAAAVGAELTVTPELHITERGKEVPRIALSLGDIAMGFLPHNVYKQVSRLIEQGWTCRAFIEASIFVKPSKSYWIEAAVICYPAQHAAAFDTFSDAISKRISKGERPAIALSPKEQARVIESDGQWAETKSLKYPKLDRDSAYYKTKRTMAENMAYEAAAGNKGCYVGTALIALCIIFIVVWFFFLR